MKPKQKLFILLLVLGILPYNFLAAQGDSLCVENQQSTTFTHQDREKMVQEVIVLLNEAKPPYFREPGAPRFLLTDRQGKFALGIGAVLQAVAEYDFDGIVKNVDFYPSYIPLKGATGVKNEFQMDISTSKIFIKMVGRNRVLGNILFYTAGDFRGSNNTFRLLNCYVQLRGFTFGYTYGGFMDLNATPTTVDFSGPGGCVFYRTTQFAYNYTGLKNWSFYGAIEMPNVDGIYETDSDLRYTSEAAAQRMPDFTGNIQYSWGPESQIRAAGIVRSMTYNSFNNKGDISAKSAIGWGVQLSSTFMLGRQFQIFAQGNYGHGIGQFFNDKGNLNLDLVPDTNNPEKMQAIPMMGWYAAIQYNIKPNLFVSSIYSAYRLYSENGWPVENSDFFRYGQYFAANVFWNITNCFQVGAEYLRGWRTGFLDKSTRHANRINVMVQYSL